MAALDEDHTFRSACSISRSLELLGDKWTLLLVRDLAWHGKTTFQELQNSVDGIPTNILSERLKRLMKWGLVERQPYQHNPVRYRYTLTKAGRDLEPALVELMKWGNKHLGGGLFRPALDSKDK